MSGNLLGKLVHAMTGKEGQVDELKIQEELLTNWKNKDDLKRKEIAAKRGNIVQNGVKVQGKENRICNCGDSGRAHLRTEVCV